MLSVNEWSATHSLLSWHSRRSALLPIDDDSKAKGPLRSGPTKERGRSARNDAILRKGHVASGFIFAKIKTYRPLLRTQSPTYEIGSRLILLISPEAIAKVEKATSWDSHLSLGDIEISGDWRLLELAQVLQNFTDQGRRI